MGYYAFDFSKPLDLDKYPSLQTLPPHSRLVVALSNVEDLAKIILGCYQKQIVVIPLNPKLSERDISYIVNHSQANAIFTDTGLTFCKNKRISPVDDRLIMYTSGSTGNPKGVVLGDDAIKHNAIKTSEIHSFQANRTHATCLPLFHCNALVMSLLGSYFAKSKLVIFEKFEPAYFFSILDREKVETASLVPALLYRLIQASPSWPRSLRYLITAAAPLTKEICLNFFNLYGPRIRQGYGLTEAVNFSCKMPLLTEEEFIYHYIDNHPPIGVPLDETEISIDENGKIFVRGPNLMKGYWRNSAETRKAINNGWLYTGDVGYWRGNYVVLSGRKKEMINRGGEKYYPLELEEKWDKVGLQRPFAAVPIPSEVYHNEIGLCIQNQAISEVIPKLEAVTATPLTVQSNYYLETSTGKPMRIKMGNELFCFNTREVYYPVLLKNASDIASWILKNTSPEKEHNDQVNFIVKSSKELVSYSEKYPISGSNNKLTGIAREALDLFKEVWPQVLDSTITGELAVKSRKGFWEKLMCDWPMGDYSHMMKDYLIHKKLLSNSVLELGSGVGNTSRLIKEFVNSSYIRTDLYPQLCKRLDIPGEVCFYDFNTPSHFKNIDTVFAVNALHCSSNPLKSLEYIYHMLSSNGTLVIAEGMPVTSKDEAPWALTPFFGLFNGWWDEGGFIDRKVWIQMLEEVGYKKIGYSALRSGKHDLGGLIWGEK